MSVTDQWKLIDTDGFTRSSVKQVHYKYIKIHSGSYQFEESTGKREPTKCYLRSHSSLCIVAAICLCFLLKSHPALYPFLSCFRSSGLTEVTPRLFVTSVSPVIILALSANYSLSFSPLKTTRKASHVFKNIK